MLEKILVPLDGSALSDRILHPVRKLSERDSEVMLLHILPEDLVGPGDPRAAKARELLEERSRRLATKSRKVRSQILIGDAAERILDCATEYAPSLIAMSTHGRSGLLRWIRGGVAERVLRSSSWPLLLANPTGLAQPFDDAPLRRILLPLDPLDRPDGGPPLIPLVVEIARRFGCEVLLLAVVEDRLGLTLQTPSTADALARRTEAEAWLETCHGLLNGVPVLKRVVTGSPAAEILNAAEGEDLVAISTHGRSGLSRWIYGSVAEHVVRHCACPMLVVRTGGPSLHA